jgi:predicted nucleic acid-binding protein
MGDDRWKTLAAHRQPDHRCATSIRAQEFKAMRFRTYDALHLACAEQAMVNIFLTTDDRVLRIAASHAAELHIRVANPLIRLMEVR